MAGAASLFDKPALLVLLQRDRREAVCHCDLGAVANRPHMFLQLHSVWEAIWAGETVTYPKAQTKVTEGRRKTLLPPSMQLLSHLQISSGLV